METSAAFFKEVSGKLATAIMPTVYSQEKKEDAEAEPLAAELICIDGDVDVDVGTCAGPGFTLPTNKTVTITFRAQIANTPGLTQVSNQGTVSGTNFASYLTDDPDIAGTNNPTVTLLDSTAVAVTSNINPSVFGQSVTFTATMTGVPARISGNPTGTVQFKADGTNIGSPVNVVAGAVNTATAQVSISTLTVGNHVITAEYSGGGGYNARTGTRAGGQNVNRANTSVGIISSQNPSLTTQPVTFTATVNVTATGAGTPTGTVTFNVNGAAAPTCTSVALSGAAAQCSLSDLGAGIQSITAAYSGDASFNISSSVGLSQTVSNTAVWDGSTSGDWTDATNWTTNFAPTAVHNVSIPAAGVTNQPVFGACTTTVGSLTLGAGRSLTINNAATLVVNGALTMSGNNIDASAGLLKLGTAATISRTSGLILGDVEKDFGATGAFTYPVGTATGFSPVAVNITALAQNPSSLRVRANDGTAPATPPLADATTLDRYWKLPHAYDIFHKRLCLSVPEYGNLSPL